MAESNCIDYVKILCRSGKGGAGSCHFHRAKYVPKGGPDGGDGGRGGHIILKGNRNMWTLLPLKYRRHIFAGNGTAGSKGRSFGKDGDDVIIEVPCGTVVFEAETGKYLCEVTDDGQEVYLLRGGRGGLGNWHFKSATNRTPRFAQPGEPAIEKSIILELKMLADVGLVGFPNAGKSTLLSVLSAARPKIANYPFTTMEPQLGIVAYRDNRSFAMADIPGIIEGASEGKGLGLRFLRHIERNAVLLFMIAADADDIAAEYAILRRELQQFNPQLLDKHHILAITKSDMLDEELEQEIAKTLPPDVPHVFISSITSEGLTELKDTLWRAITDEANQLATPDIIHRPLDGQHRVREEDEFIFENTPMADDDDFEGEDLRSISPDAWGEEYDDGEDYDDYDDDDNSVGDASAAASAADEEDYDDEEPIDNEQIWLYESELEDDNDNGYYD